MKAMNETNNHLVRGRYATGRSEWLYAMSFICLLIVASIIIAPVQAHYIGVFNGFFQLYGVALATIDALTAALLFWRAAATNAPRLSWLGAVYLFTVPLVLANVLALPGAILPIGTVPTQAASFLWLEWHLGFGIGALLFTMRRFTVKLHPVLLAAVALLLSAVAIWVAFRDPFLPTLVTGPMGTFTAVSRHCDIVVLLVYCAGLALLQRRFRKLSSLELWFGVALFALALDRFLFTEIFPLSRFTIGFYFARDLSLFSSFVVVVALFMGLVRTVRRADAIDNYAAVSERLPVIALMLDQQGACVFVNPAWGTLTGQSSTEALGDGFQAVVFSGDWDIDASGHFQLEDRTIRIRDQQNGEYRRHLLRSASLESYAGAANLGALFVAVDVEEEARAEAARYESDLRFQGLLEVSPQILMTTDPAGAVDWYNAAWYEYTGLTFEESLGWGWQAAHHLDDLAKVMESWPEALATGKPISNDFRLRRHDGSYQWFLSMVAPYRNAKGEIIRWFGSITNIDAQKRESERSIRIARVLQEAFLPEVLPHIDACRLDAVYRPAESDGLVGGDWYDVIGLPDGRFILSCGDVAGHGLEAATLAGRYRQSITITALENADPASIITRVNRIAVLQNEGIATAIVALFDPHTRRLEYASAGHTEPVVASHNIPAFTLSSGDLPIGIFLDASWTTRELTLAKDACVVFYTDGLTEFARDATAAEEKLKDAATELMQRSGNKKPAEWITDRVLAGAVPKDDIAVLLLMCGHASAKKTAPVHLEYLRSWRFHSSDALTAHTTRLTLTEYLKQHAAAEADTFEAELVIGEIIANTVEHAPGLVEIKIDWTGKKPRFTVRDAGPGIDGLQMPELVDVLNEDGRGLFLIQALASDVVIRRAQGFGTEICCTLPIERADIVDA